MKTTDPQPGNDLPAKKENASSDQGGKAKLPPGRTWLWFLLILLFNYYLMSELFPSATEPVKIPYTLFKSEIGKGNVEAVYTKGETITGQLGNLSKVRFGHLFSFHQIGNRIGLVIYEKY